jgi:hypothetical protein
VTFTTLIFPDHPTSPWSREAFGSFSRSSPNMTDLPEEAALAEEAPKYKLYSAKAVTAATFLGGPMAIGLLMRRNFLNLGKKSEASRALWFSIAFSIFLFGGLSLLPEEVVDRIPGSLIAGIYTAAAYQLMQLYQGKALTEHGRLGGLLYSGWKTFGVALGSLVATLLLMVAVIVTLDPGVFSYESYNKGVERFNVEESRALELYSLLEKDGTADEEVVTFLKQTGIPAWEECLQILDELDQEKYLDDDLKAEIAKLRTYVGIRLETYKAMQTLFSGEGDEEKLTKKINDLQEEIKPYLN